MWERVLDELKIKIKSESKRNVICIRDSEQGEKLKNIQDLVSENTFLPKDFPFKF